MAKVYKVFCGVARPNMQDGSPLYKFYTTRNTIGDLQHLLSQYVDEGWEIVSLTLPSSYSDIRGEHYGPATIVFSRKADYR